MTPTKADEDAAREWLGDNLGDYSEHDPYWESRTETLAAFRAEARREAVAQKSALVLARVALTECVGQAATVLYRESAKERPSRDSLRAEAKRLDGFLLAHRTVGLLPRPGTETAIRQSEREACERIVEELMAQADDQPENNGYWSACWDILKSLQERAK